MLIWLLFLKVSNLYTDEGFLLSLTDLIFQVYIRKAVLMQAWASKPGSRPSAHWWGALSSVSRGMSVDSLGHLGLDIPDQSVVTQVYKIVCLPPPRFMTSNLPSLPQLAQAFHLSLCHLLSLGVFVPVLVVERLQFFLLLVCSQKNCSEMCTQFWISMLLSGNWK